MDIVRIFLSGANFIAGEDSVVLGPGESAGSGDQFSVGFGRGKGFSHGAGDSAGSSSTHRDLDILTLDSCGGIGNGIGSGGGFSDGGAGNGGGDGDDGWMLEELEFLKWTF